MIEKLEPGLRVMLPSGNILTLVRCERRNEWTCEYTELARARGEVVFTAEFLRAWARRV